MYAAGPIKNALIRNTFIAHRTRRIFHNGQFSVDCKACQQAGHKAGDPACPAMNTELEMTCFATHHVVLSNTYHNKISAYGQTFKSVQHAWLWKRAYENKQLDLAQRIKDAEHAGIATKLSNGIKDSRDPENDTSIMKHLLTLKVKQCTDYQAALLNSVPVVAAAITDKFWGTGLSTQAKTRTTPEYWPGNDMLGKIMADIRGDIATRQNTQDNLEQIEGSPNKDNETDAGTLPDGDAASGEAQVDTGTTPGGVVATSSNITDTPGNIPTIIPSKTTNASERLGGEHDARSRTRTMRKVTHTSSEPPHARNTPSVFDTWRNRKQENSPPHQKNPKQTNIGSTTAVVYSGVDSEATDILPPLAQTTGLNSVTANAKVS